MIEVRLLRYDRMLSGEEWNELCRFVSGEKQQRLARFHAPEDAQRSLLAELLAKLTASRETSRSLHEIHIRRGPWGKPYFVCPSNLRFNVSHSRGWIAVAVDRDDVGIDVEEEKPTNLAIAKRFFHEKESRRLLEMPPAERLRCFYVFWTLKESYVKLIGAGLRIPLNIFSFDIDDLAEIRIELSEREVGGIRLPDRCRFDVIRPAAGTIVSVSSLSGNSVRPEVYRGLDPFLRDWKRQIG